MEAVSKDFELKLESMLNDSQKVIFDEICEYIEAEKTLEIERVFKGYAGVGKTFIAQTLSQKYKSKIIFLAPTNEAVKVLSQKITHSPCLTLHKALALRPKWGELIQGDPISFNDFKAAIVDESSMLSDELHRYLYDSVKYSYAKIIYVGDPAQIIPVDKDAGDKIPEERMASVFRGSSKLKGWELTKIVRQAEGNPIIEMSKIIREKGFSPKAVLVDNKTIYLLHRTKQVNDSILLRFIDSGGVYCAYTNKTVNDFNQKIQKMKYPKSNGFFVEGQKIICGAPIFDYITSEAAPKIIANNGERLVIKSISNIQKMFNYQAVQVEAENDEGESIEFPVLHPNSYSDYDFNLKQLASSKSWGMYYKYKEIFADIRHPYALTCHKLQGSTVDKIMIDINDIMVCRSSFERDKLFYVAVTRAANKVAFIYD